MVTKTKRIILVMKMHPYENWKSLTEYMHFGLKYFSSLELQLIFFDD